MANYIRCPRCGEEKSADAFHKHRNRKNGRASLCKACCKEVAAARYPSVKDKQREQARAWNLANPERYMANQLRNAFGISLEHYKQMLEEQGGVCAICGGHAGKRLHVDHNHDTGAIRGLLCGLHNRGLGMFNDELTLLRAAVAYLEKYQGDQPKA